ncbi:uncharacterized protein LOC131431584 [Malaya genurostris]|uniref:uncharacterized protein LOC131431584 n=1 Tax=Malaya genurostris TaxID=325434 RepID=UPI0026F3C53F|nr:uncharacterized protein LOC131431584 [Malaya genurostris]
MMKCIVPGCRSKENKSRANFYNVPSTGYSVFREWKKFLNLSECRTEKICRRHFTVKDFNIHNRIELKDDAIPSLRIPQSGPKVDIEGACCVFRCGTKNSKKLRKFPSRKAILNRWLQTLEIGEHVTTKHKICLRHFTVNDYVKVTRRYLKPSAIPSKHMKKLVKYPKRFQRAKVPPSHLWDHNYCVYYRTRLTTNRVCYVMGCSSRACKGISLHKFPIKNNSLFKSWTKALQCSVMPTKNSRVCSKHFRKSDFVQRGRVLKKTAIPINKSSATTMYGINSVECSDLSLCDDNSVEDLSTSKITNSPPQSSSHDTENNLKMTIIKNSSCETNEIVISPAEEATADVDVQVDNYYGHIVQETVKNVQKDNSLILSDLLQTDFETNIWTGISTLEQLEEICLAVKTLEDNLYPRKFKMHATYRVILSLAKLKQNISYEALGTLFRISGVTVSKYISHTIQMLARVLRRFVYWPSREELQKNVPLCFREHFTNVTVVLDAFEVPVATLKCLNCRISCYSHYKSHRTVKFLVGVSSG